MHSIKWVSLPFIAVLTVGCAVKQEDVFYTDVGCNGNVDREYSVTLETETGEVTTEQTATCRSIEPEPFGGQRLPTTKELKEGKKRQ